MSFITARSPVSAEVVLRSLHGLVLVKKDGPSVGVLNSYQVLSSTVPASSPSVGISARSLSVLGSTVPAAVRVSVGKSAQSLIGSVRQVKHRACQSANIFVAY